MEKSQPIDLLLLSYCSSKNFKYNIEEFVYKVDYIDGFSYVVPSLHPWYETYFSMMDDFSDVSLDWICYYFIEYFCINVHEGCWSES
ncbi:hypothetical protein H671_2g5921 [Cricetulus griseus]|uniref:Uncharacterized protein n=1 Tax=Cricetulus griseus TaxID=10029 RepID=A0A061IEK6_CRIGR|nr:hypothetical protein H671_2g5921 [Cricetulus griseus]